MTYPAQKKLNISVLIPCHNEELSIRRCVQSCLNQTRMPDQIIVVDDASTDDSVEILKTFGDRITLLCLKKNTGNKSYVQEHGLKHVTGDVFITTDGDTILDKEFVATIEHSFADPEVAAVGGYIKSIKHNWLTALREIDYVIGQNIHKLAQSLINFTFVIPGCAGAFRTDTFRSLIRFDHDTLTEDLDFTYKLHRQGQRVVYNRDAIAYTQDPSRLSGYINQMRRWYGGGWQNLLKHYRVAGSPFMALELTLMYVEGLLFSTLLFMVPLLNLRLFGWFFLPYAVFLALTASYAAYKSRRTDLIAYAPLYPILLFGNAYVFIEQFVKEIIFRQKNLIWYQPERLSL